MTYSNGTFNPHPLANPFNTRLGPANYTFNQNGCSYKRNICRIASNQAELRRLTVPDAKPYDSVQTMNDNLTVPNQLDAPVMNCANVDLAMLNQMYPNNYIAPDGRIYDLNTHKIVFDPNAKSQMNGEWGPTKIVGQYSSPQWDNREIYAPPVEDVQFSGIDKRSRDYWQHIEKEKPSELNDLQKELLSELEAGTLVKPSRLEPEV